MPEARDDAGSSRKQIFLKVYKSRWEDRSSLVGTLTNRSGDRALSQATTKSAPSCSPVSQISAKEKKKKKKPNLHERKKCTLSKMTPASYDVVRQISQCSLLLRHPGHLDGEQAKHMSLK